MVKLPTVCYRFTRGNWMGMKARKIGSQKSDRLQKGVWNNKRFDRG